MLAVLKNSNSYWKTDYILSTFGNKYGVKHWQHGIVKKAKPISYLISMSLIFFICQMGQLYPFSPLRFTVKARVHVYESILIKVKNTS